MAHDSPVTLFLRETTCTSAPISVATRSLSRTLSKALELDHRDRPKQVLCARRFPYWESELDSLYSTRLPLSIPLAPAAQPRGDLGELPVEDRLTQVGHQARHERQVVLGQQPHPGQLARADQVGQVGAREPA
jgi:hypothetical protein